MQTRRQMRARSTQVATMLITLGLFPGVKNALAAPYNAGAFEAKTMADLMKILGAGTPTESKDVSITGPEIAENGAVVPIGASTSLPGANRILILVEKNPSVLSAMFEITDAIEANFTTRVKMGQSSHVFAVALMNDGRVLYATKEVKVTLGGCGG